MGKGKSGQTHLQSREPTWFWLVSGLGFSPRGMGTCRSSILPGRRFFFSSFFRFFLIFCFFSFLSLWFSCFSCHSFPSWLSFPSQVFYCSSVQLVFSPCFFFAFFSAVFLMVLFSFLSFLCITSPLALLFSCLFCIFWSLVHPVFLLCLAFLYWISWVFCLPYNLVFLHVLLTGHGMPHGQKGKQIEVRRRGSPWM